MCQECRQYPCHYACPNASEPETICDCECCSEPIYECDEVYEYDGNYYHKECFEDNAVSILLKEGAVFFTAEKSEEDYDE